jgi:hypothetical protein
MYIYSIDDITNIIEKYQIIELTIKFTILAKNN